MNQNKRRMKPLWSRIVAGSLVLKRAHGVDAQGEKCAALRSRLPYSLAGPTSLVRLVLTTSLRLSTFSNSRNRQSLVIQAGEDTRMGFLSRLITLFGLVLLAHAYARFPPPFCQISLSLKLDSCHESIHDLPNTDRIKC